MNVIEMDKLCAEFANDMRQKFIDAGYGDQLDFCLMVTDGTIAAFGGEVGMCVLLGAKLDFELTADGQEIAYRGANAHGLYRRTHHHNPHLFKE